MEKAFPLTTAFAEAIVSAEPLRDEAAVTVARKAMVDWLACAFGGAADRTTRILLEQLPVGAGDAVIIGQGRRTDALTAALVNAHAGHVLDYDDVHASVRGHPTTVIVPVLLALASEERLSADRLIAGYIVGLEAMARGAVLRRLLDHGLFGNGGWSAERGGKEAVEDQQAPPQVTSEDELSAVVDNQRLLSMEPEAVCRSYRDSYKKS